MIIVKKGVDFSKVDFKEGAVILIDKPLDWTSFDVVNKLRFALRKKYGQKKFKVGHNGTLDPLATGLLMVFTGKYTKRIPQEENHDKRYIGEVKFGATTETLDREKPEVNILPTSHLSKTLVEEKIARFKGEMQQEIPAYSATKVGGVPMYKLARQKKDFKPKTKLVNFHHVHLLKYDSPFITVDILCGKGTYIRAFARDLGRDLSTSAYLYSLRRTDISSYSVKDALDVHEVFNAIYPDRN